jgi:rRNA processing protein Krr1/Pno1
MLIGPKGMYHKMLEEISGCYMLIKGRNAMN